MGNPNPSDPGSSNESLLGRSRFGTHIQGNIGIFLDEIDTMLSLDKNQFSTDDFFAAIRAAYNKRSNQEAFKRLNFCILGVASPQDLMSDHERTPFNIGRAIRLGNFSDQEARVMKEGLSTFRDDADEVLGEIMQQTAGQPFLTQRLCLAIAEHPQPESTPTELIAQLINQLFYRNNIINEEPHFSNIQGRLLRNEEYNFRMLQAYQKLRKVQSIPIDPKSPEQLYLKLSGLVAEREGELQINNPIYAAVFDEPWLEKSIGDINRPFTNDLQRWLNTQRSEDALLKGSVLEEALTWANHREDLSREEREFLQASQISEQIQAEKERQSGRLRRYLIIAVIAAILATGTSIAAIIYAREANDQTIIANNKTIEAQDATKEAKASLEQFKQEQANRVSTEVDNIIERAMSLKAAGYATAPVWKNLLIEASNILDEYPENDSLIRKKQAVQNLLNPTAP